MKPAYIWHTGYAELRRVLNPRWYAATRLGYVESGSSGRSGDYEFSVGFRPGTNELLKCGYQIRTGEEYRGTLGNSATIELVFSFRAISLAK